MFPNQLSLAELEHHRGIFWGRPNSHQACCEPTPTLSLVELVIGPVVAEAQDTHLDDWLVS